jgi:hypothetical protein
MLVDRGSGNQLDRICRLPPGAEQTQNATSIGTTDGITGKYRYAGGQQQSCRREDERDERHDEQSHWVLPTGRGRLNCDH